jgi:Flp pilus assembly pilin Flp
MSLVQRLRNFRKDEGGSAAVEICIMAPLLAWAFLATVVYFHAYRSESVAAKATLTVADMVSRETGYITPSYLNGIHNLLNFLTMSDDYPEYRLTVFTWDEDDNRFEVRWSRERGNQPVLNTSSLQAYADRLPVMVDDQRAILVETWSSYKPPFNTVGLTEFDFENFMVINPRFAPQLCWNSDPQEDPSKAKC